MMPRHFTEEIRAAVCCGQALVQGPSMMPRHFTEEIHHAAPRARQLIHPFNDASAFHRGNRRIRTGCLRTRPALQ